MIRLPLFFVVVGIVVGAVPAPAQENMDGLTFREIHFGILLDELIDRPRYVAVAPDGRDAYVCSRLNASIVQFRRNADGTLEPGASVQAPDPENPGNPFGIGNIAFSPDGRFIYAEINRNLSRGLAWFRRDSSDGALTLIDHVLPVVEEDCDMFSLVISPDGEFAYMLGILPPSVEVLVVFALDRNSGMASIAQRIDRQPENVATGQYLSFQLLVSPDGRNLYASAAGQGGIEIFDVDRSTGEVSFVRLVSTEVSPTSRPQSIAISPDGAHVYTADSTAGTITTLDRDATSGDLTLAVSLGNPGTVPLPNARQVVASPQGDRVYATSMGGSSFGILRVSAYARDPNSGALTLLEHITDGITGTYVLQGDNWPTVSPDGETLYVPAESTDALAVFASTRPSLPCENFPDIRDAYTDLQAAYALPNDVDQDGVPELATLGLLEEASCNPFLGILDESLTNAYLINLSSTNWEAPVEETGEWIPYQSAFASLLLTSAAMQIYLNTAFEPFEQSLTQVYLPVGCVDDICGPAEARTADEPFSGEGDPDEDGFTNAEEWANVLARGGDEHEFAVSAIDPANDGTITISSSGGGGSCFIATAAYGTPLAAELDTLRTFRDRHLLTNPFGAAFVDTYYRLSSPAAGFIAQHPRLRAVTRTLLKPMVWRIGRQD